MTYKKITLNSLIAVMLVAGLFSCAKKLDQLPQTSLTDANYWKTTNDLKLACNYLYSYLPGLNSDAGSGIAAPYLDNYTEIGYNLSSGANSISNGSRLASATSEPWSNYYRLIRACNNIMEKSVHVTGDEGLIRQYLGEARFFRALAYFNLVKRFGDVPYINRTLSMTDSMLYAPRLNRQIVIDSIYADLSYASANLPAASIQVSSEYGRITSGASTAYKARVALFEGTWDKFHGTGSDVGNLDTVIAACNRLMSGGEYRLFEYPQEPEKSYFYLFQYQDAASQTNWSYANNKEIILPHLYGVNMSSNYVSHSFERGGATDGAVSATRLMINKYLYKDGLPIGKSAYDSSAAETSSVTVFRNRDPRFGMTFFQKSEDYPSINGIIPYTPRASYNIKKYNTISDFSASTSFMNFWVLRYAEVLLNYAEAVYEKDGSISDADLNKSVNLIRARAGLLPLSNQFVLSNGLDMRTEIRRERTVELCFEGFHYWDILRWKTAETVLPQSILGEKYFPEEMPTVSDPPLDNNGFIILEDKSKRSFQVNRDYLWPLPTKEIGLNPDKLKQNPNWE